MPFSELRNCNILISASVLQQCEGESAETFKDHISCTSNISLTAAKKQLGCLTTYRRKTYRVKVEISQGVLQPVVILSNGDLSLQPWRKPQPDRNNSRQLGV